MLELFQVGKVASILIKLLMDMWIAGDPQDTFALVLSMLQAALAQPDTPFSHTRLRPSLQPLAACAHDRE